MVSPIRVHMGQRRKWPLAPTNGATNHGTAYSHRARPAQGARSGPSCSETGCRRVRRAGERQHPRGNPQSPLPPDLTPTTSISSLACASGSPGHPTSSAFGATPPVKTTRRLSPSATISSLGISIDILFRSVECVWHELRTSAPWMSIANVTQLGCAS